MLRDYVRLNQSMFVAIAVALPVSAVAADALSGLEPHLNATYATIVDYAAYLGTFGLMFYITNRHRYRAGPGGRPAEADPRSDLKKILASLGAGEVAYGVVRWVLHYYMIDAWGYEPYASSVTAQVAAIAVYLVVMNLSVRATRMYSSNSNSNSSSSNNGSGSGKEGQK